MRHNVIMSPGNLLTVVALLRCQKLRSHATTAFVISLAASDLLFSAINLPLTASRYVVNIKLRKIQGVSKKTPLCV